MSEDFIGRVAAEMRALGAKHDVQVLITKAPEPSAPISFSRIPVVDYDTRIVDKK